MLISEKINDYFKKKTSTPAVLPKLPGGLVGFSQRFKNYFTPTNQVRLRDVLREVPESARQILFPGRGFSEKELKQAKPGLKENLLAAPRAVAEIASSLGELTAGITSGQAVDKFLATKLGKQLADIGSQIGKFAEPGTPEQAKAMRFVDVASFLPVGAVKNIGLAARAIAPLKDANLIAKELKSAGVTTEVIKTLAPKLVNLTDEKQIADLISKGLVVPKEYKTDATAWSRWLNTGNKVVETPQSWGNEYWQVRGPKPEKLVGKQFEKIKTTFDEVVARGGTNPAEIGPVVRNEKAFTREKDFVQFKSGDRDVFVNKAYVDPILKQHPNAKPFIGDDRTPVIFKVDNEPVGTAMPLTDMSEDLRGLVRAAPEAPVVAPKEAPQVAQIASSEAITPKDIQPINPRSGLEVNLQGEAQNMSLDTFKRGYSNYFGEDMAKVEKYHGQINQAVKGEIKPTAPIPPSETIRPPVAPEKPPVAPEAKTPTPEPQSISRPETLNQLKQKPPETAIAQTAREVKEPTTLVGRVVNSLRKTKTEVLEYIQNKEERVRQLVSKKNVVIDDASDPYLKMTLYPGRVANKIELVKNEAKSIVSEMKAAGVSRKEVSDYLLYRHAPERNAALGEKAAGITTTEAETGLKALESLPKGAQIKTLADRVQKINEQTLDLLRESGVISDDFYKALREKYKNHVPLNRIFEETEDIGQTLSARGFDVRSTGVKRAYGSEREVADIMTNVLTNYEQAVLRSEKNIVDQATLAFVRKNKDILGDLFEIVKPQAVGKTFEGVPLLERTTDPNILQLFENGKKIWIKINDPALAVALRGVGKEKLGTLLNAIGSFTRLYSGLATRFNPEFFLSNKIRDLQETAVYLAAQKEVGFKGAVKTVARDPVSVKDVLDALRGANTKGAQLYNELKYLGGTTGGFGLSTRKQVELNLGQLEKLANSRTRQVADNLIEYVDNWNTIFEDSTRLSVYKQALEQGLSKERAAAMAKEASINFNRMGRGGPVINALWMFSNASIQGSVKILRALKNPKVLGATLITVGGAVAAVNEWNDKSDPKWRDKVSRWDRLNGLTVVLPSTDEQFRYFTIPVSWGLKPIKVMSDYAYDAIDGQEFNTERMIEDTVTAMMEAYNPVGGTDIVSALVPTFLDVPVELARNRSWSGNRIRPDFDPNAPADIKYFSSLEKTKTGQAAISVSQFLQENLGASVSPADIKYAFDQYIGGAGRAVSKTTNLIGSLSEPPPLDEWPLISRFYREREPEEIGAGASGQSQEIKKLLETQSRQRFEIKTEAEKLDNELQKLSPAEANARAREIKQSNPQLYEKLKDVVSDRKLGLTYSEKMIKQLGVENGERARYIHQQALKLKTSQERNAYIKNLRQKKIISDKVFEQLKKMVKSKRQANGLFLLGKMTQEEND